MDPKLAARLATQREKADGSSESVETASTTQPKVLPTFRDGEQVQGNSAPAVDRPPSAIGRIRQFSSSLFGPKRNSSLIIAAGPEVTQSGDTIAPNTSDGGDAADDPAAAAATSSTSIGADSPPADEEATIPVTPTASTPAEQRPPPLLSPVAPGGGWECSVCTYSHWVPPYLAYF